MIQHAAFQQLIFFQLRFENPGMMAQNSVGKLRAGDSLRNRMFHDSSEYIDFLPAW
jgi:hypothetical protein